MKTANYRLSFSILILERVFYLPVPALGRFTQADTIVPEGVPLCCYHIAARCLAIFADDRQRNHLCCLPERPPFPQ